MRTFDSEVPLMNNFCVKNPGATVPLGVFVWENDARLFAMERSRRDRSELEVMRMRQDTAKALYVKGEAV